MSGSEGSEGPLAEFVALRAEVLQSSQAQHQFLALRLTIAGALSVIAASQKITVQTVLVIRILSYVFCVRSTYFIFAIEETAGYIRANLESRVPGGVRCEHWLQR